jgi:hypothetical protein
LSVADETTPIAAAEEAWTVGDIGKAGKLYEKALAEGGLSASDTLAAFVRVGAWYAATGKRDAAIHAFRNAAIIDPSFAYPDEAGPKGKPLYESARKEAAGQALEITVEAPKKLEPAHSFEVQATVPEALAPLFDALAIHVEDKPGDVVHVEEKALETNQVKFEVPASAAVAGRKLEVRVSALGPQKNEWVRRTLRIPVAAPPAAPEPVAALPPKPVTTEQPGFFATKWPYLAGGAAALVAVGVIVAVVAGGSNVVTVNAPTWQTAGYSR